MKNLFKPLKTAAAAALCAVGVLSMSGCENYEKMMREQPMEYISMAMDNTAESVVRGTFSDGYQLLKAAMEDGSVTLGFEAEGVTFKGECAVSEKSQAVSQLYTVTGSEGASAQIYAYTDKNGMKFGTIGKSGSHIYDMSFDNLAEKLAASVFAPDSGSEYAMSQSDYDKIIAYIDEISDAVSGNEDERDKYSAVLEDYFNAHQPAIEEKTDADIGGETVSSNIITYTIPTEDVKMLAEQIIDLALEDYKFDEEMSEYYNKETVKEEFTDMLSEIDELSVTAAYYINAKTNVLMRSDITLNIGDENYKMEAYINAFYGADPANAEKQSLSMGIKDDDMDMSINADVTRGENITTAVVSMNDYDGESQELLTLISERDGSAYKISLDVPDAELSAKVEGTLETSKNSFSLTVDSFSISYEENDISYSPKASVTVKKGGEISVLDAEGEFLDLTEEELDALLENIGSDFEEVIDQATGGAFKNYINKSKISQANANAKNVHTICSAAIVQAYVDGEEFGGIIEGSGMDLTVGGEKIDLYQFMPDDYYGYVYGYADKDTAVVEYIVWSENPIPEEYKRQIAAEEQENLAGEGIIIGRFPLQ